jgi:hypothetical protein
MYSQEWLQMTSKYVTPKNQYALNEATWRCNQVYSNMDIHRIGLNIIIGTYRPIAKQRHSKHVATNSNNKGRPLLSNVCVFCAVVRPEAIIPETEASSVSSRQTRKKISAESIL